MSSTRCNIAIKHQNGQIESIYCQGSDVIDNTEFYLLTYYNTSEKVRELVNLGNIRTLCENIEDTETYKQFYTKNIEEYKTRINDDTSEEERNIWYASIGRTLCCIDKTKAYTFNNYEEYLTSFNSSNCYNAYLYDAIEQKWYAHKLLVKKDGQNFSTKLSEKKELVLPEENHKAKILVPQKRILSK